MKLIYDHDLEPTGEFASRIRDFRAAITHIAEREAARPVVADWLAPARKRRRSHQHRLVLGWVCAAALCFATVPFAIMPLTSPSNSVPAHATAKQTPPPASLVPSKQQESGLMEQIDADVSEPVPASLAPLTELGSTDTASTSGDSPFSGVVLAQPGSPNAH